MPLTKVAESQEVHEYACHEGNNAKRTFTAPSAPPTGREVEVAFSRPSI